MALKILLVDDSNTTRSLIKALLAPYGVDAVHIPCDGDLCESIRRERPTLVILDLVMFPTAAAEVVQKIRRCPVSGNTPLVITTGWLRQERQYQEAGCDVVVRKPFTRLTLLSALVDALQRPFVALRPGEHLELPSLGPMLSEGGQLGGHR